VKCVIPSAIDTSYPRQSACSESPKVSTGETAVVAGTGSPEPHVVLQAADRRLAGSDGCNRLVAGYTLESDRIHFTQAASTMMACAEGMETAQRFAAAIAAASRWRVLGQQLELYDSEDRLLARFEARPAP
jgi:heat shock protein HslJ